MYKTNHHSERLQELYKEDCQLWRTIDYIIEEDLPFDMESRYKVLSLRCRKVINKLNKKGIYKYILPYTAIL